MRRIPPRAALMALALDRRSLAAAPRATHYRTPLVTKVATGQELPQANAVQATFAGSGTSFSRTLVVTAYYGRAEELHLPQCGCMMLPLRGPGIARFALAETDHAQITIRGRIGIPALLAISRMSGEAHKRRY